MVTTRTVWLTLLVKHWRLLVAKRKSRRTLCICGCRRELPLKARLDGDPYATTLCAKLAYGTVTAEDARIQRRNVDAILQGDEPKVKEVPSALTTKHVSSRLKK